jgi:hypothetical protein
MMRQNAPKSFIVCLKCILFSRKSVMSDHSDERIRLLCAQAIEEANTEKLRAILAELNTIIRIRIQEARELSAAAVKVAMMIDK